MIKVKTLFHGWKEITEERAREWAHNIKTGAINMTSEEKLNCINSRLKGLQFKSLDEI